MDIAKYKHLQYLPQLEHRMLISNNTSLYLKAQDDQRS